MSSKYSKEFKLKVLEYYFEHGGDKKFGNKARTASHFCIDHKTVTRMLCNPEMVKKARKTLGGKKSVGTENAKSSKPNIKNGQPFVSIEKFISPQQKNQSSSSSSSKSSQSSKKINSSPRTTSEVPIIELPEDPDFSVLKSSIDTSVSSVSHVARLLVTATAEVKYLLANECDLIFECKVCRNLFRSVINFLAHKRNYCDEKYINVKNMFHKDTHSNMTTESSTAFVEPEPPPTHVEGESSPSDFPEALENTEVDKTPLRKIDKIASNLVKKKEKVVLTSSPTNKGSSEYYKSIENVNNARKSVGTDCTVVLKDIKDVSGAVYQSVASRNEVPVSPKKTSRQRKRDRPIHLDSKGKVVEKKDDIIKAPLPLAVQEKVSVPVIEKMEEMEVDVSCNSCNSIFSSKKLLNAHIEETHGLERMVYTCPICNVIFLSIWGCVKHLVRVHKKKRHHRDRLKHVICSRAYKKVFTPKEIAKHSHKSCSQISKSHDNKVEDISGETSSPLCVVKDELEKVDSLEKTKEGNNSRIPVPGADEESPGFFRNKQVSRMVCCDPELECEICGKRFSSKSSRLTHQRSHGLIVDPSYTLSEEACPVERPKGLKLKLRSRNKESSVTKLEQESINPNCDGIVNDDNNKKIISSPLLSQSDITEDIMSSQNINIPYSTVNNSIIRISPADNRELENVCEKERLHYNIRPYDVGCSFLRAFEHEQKLNTHNPVDFLFNKSGFNYSVKKVERCCSSVKFLFHKNKNTTLEERDSSEPLVMSPQHSLSHNDSHEEQKVKIECEDFTHLSDLDIVLNSSLPVKESVKYEVKDENILPELDSAIKDENILPNLDITINPSLPIKESDIFEAKDEKILSFSESEGPNKNEEECVKASRLLEDDGISKDVKKETIELEISEKEDNQFTNAEKLWINDFDKENIPKPVISNETVSLPLNTENSGLNQSALLHNDDQRNKVPVLVIKKSGSSENSSEEWLVSKEKSTAVEQDNHAKINDLKTKTTQSLLPEKNASSVDSFNSNLTLKFKRVEKPLSSEYKVVNSNSGDERKLNSLKVTEKSQSDLESRHEIPSLNQKMADKEIICKKDKPSNVVPPLILLKKENTVIETFTSKKRVKHSSEMSAEKSLGEEVSKSDDFENFSVKIYPKVSYKAKRLKCSHLPITLPRSDLRTTKKENTFEPSKPFNDRLQLQGHNKNLLLHRTQSFPFAQSIDMSSPSSFKLVLSNLSKSVPSSSLASSSSIQEPICNADDENVTVEDLDLHSNVSFGRLSFNDAACMPSGVNFNDTTCLPSKVNFNDAAFMSSSEVLSFSKKNSKKS